MNKELNKLEKKATNIQSIINNYRNQLSQYETTLLALIEEINQLKKNNYEKNN